MPSKEVPSTESSRPADERRDTADGDTADRDTADKEQPDGIERRHPAIVASAVALPVGLIIGVLVAAVVAARSPAREPIALGSAPAPSADSDQCRSLIAALPRSVAGYEQADLVEPAPAATMAWQQSEGEPIVLRCGLERPQEFTVAGSLQGVNGVQWFEVSGESSGIDASTWFAVDRGVFIALTLPKGTGPTPLQIVSDVVSATLPTAPLDPRPISIP